MNKTLLVAIGLVVIAAIILFMVFDNDRDTDNRETKETATTTSTVGESTDVVPQNAVELGDNDVGSQVTVERAKLSEDGYIVIHRVNANGESEVIGTSDLLEAGTYTNVTINVDGTLAADDTIVAVLHQDDGDGDFEAASDPFLAANGTAGVTTDVDVVAVPADEEDATLESQVEAFIDANLDATSTSEME